MNKRTENSSHSGGFTLIELVLVILVLGVLASVASRQFGGSLDAAKMEHTRREMDALAKAIVGDPSTYTSGTQAEFGFVGDNGDLPSNLNNLLTNPGSWSTWNGPYMESGLGSTDFKTDGWGASYSIVSASLRSSGSGTNYDKPLANSVAALTNNTVSGTIVDANQSVPGDDQMDSLKVIVSYPNGSGGTATKTDTPTARGEFSVSSIPMGNRVLRIVYLPTDDTLTIPIVVLPGRGARVDVIFPLDLF